MMEAKRRTDRDPQVFPGCAGTGTNEGEQAERGDSSLRTRWHSEVVRDRGREGQSETCGWVWQSR